MRSICPRQFPVAAVAVLPLLVLGLAGSALSDERARPNIVLMLADNLGYGDVGFLGTGGELRGMPTPRIDQLAKEGLRFTQFLTEPGCTPSRAALQTGRYPIRLGLSLVITDATSNTLQDEEITIAEMLKPLGYNTAYVGKWHLGSALQSQPQYQGYDQWRIGFHGSTDVTSYRREMSKYDAPEEMIDAQTHYVVEAERANTPARNVRVYDIAYRRQIEKDIADSSVDYIQRHAKGPQPFFLMIGWTRPHYPNVTHPDFVGKSRIGQYGDSVMELDYRTGQVLDAIRRAGIEQDTIVLFLSDNGPQRTSIFREDLMAGSSGQFRGELFDPYEGGIRTVGLVKWPGKIRPGSTNAMISLLDFFPTLAGFVGGKVPHDRPMDGVDYSDFFLGKTDRAPRQSLITFIGDRIAAVRWRQWRLYPRTALASPDVLRATGVHGIVAENSGYPAAYNIEWDPREEWDLLIENSWLLGPYMKVIGDYRKTLEDHPNPPAPNFTKY